MKPHPVILIHGLGGRPEDWQASGLVDLLVQEGGFDPRFIRLFDYGYIKIHGIPKYNYQGNIVEIAHRLSDDPHLIESYPFQVDRLSRESIAAGGPRKVDIVAHGLGGLIARYYLARSEADSHGTLYRGNVRKLVEIGVPNLGCDWLAFHDTVLGKSRIWRLLMLLDRLHILPHDFAAKVWATRATVSQMSICTVTALNNAHNQPLSPQSPAIWQLRPRGLFMKWLNRPAKTPRDIRYYCLYGDFVLQINFSAMGRKWEQCFSFGDFLVTTESATTIPGVKPVLHCFEKHCQLDMRKMDSTAILENQALSEPPPYSHAHLRDQPDVQKAVLEILTSP